jgi:hypothetical protein
MPKVTFEYSALYYLNWWLVRDRKYCAAFAATDREAQLKALREAAIAYRVARNLPLEHDFDIGIPRLQPVLDAINGAARLDFDGSDITPNILRIRDAISREYGGNDLLSVTTKFLWLRFQHPIIIYDGNVRRALGALDADLADFYAKWTAEYRKVLNHIQAACGLLPKVQGFCVDPTTGTPHYIATIAATNWFQERVFDVYLWHAGA